MRATLVFVLGALLFTAGCCEEPDKLTLQLKWKIQAQFAGYLVALEKGFYEEENLDVTINAGGPGIATPEVLANGEADIIIDWMPSALAARETGIPLVNIAQPFANSSMMLVCLRDRNVTSVVHFAGKKMGVWFAGNEYPFLSWMNRLGFDINGGKDGIEVIEQLGAVDLIESNSADCVSMLAYGFYEFAQIGLEDEDLTVFRYQDQGVSILEDGLYVLEENLGDEESVDRLQRFLRASMRGWRYAEENQEETVEIILALAPEDSDITRKGQRYMMREVAKLTDGTDGLLKVADYWRTVNILSAGGPDPVITRNPEGAWTRDITEGLEK
ncbi:MAG: ABC transporter substrate-binding protein [Hyphomicrobiales bacterium]|nr:ABC transporter substrate-binding protein [Hyphomicrobiales bacterium]